MPPWWPFTRTVTLFAAGLGLLLYDAIGRAGDIRWGILVASLTMMGLAGVIPWANGKNGNGR